MKKVYNLAIISITAGLIIISMVGCATVDTQFTQKQTETLAESVNKAAQFKGATLVFKGFYPGMPKEDAYKICDIYKVGYPIGSTTPHLLWLDDDSVWHWLNLHGLLNQPVK